MTMPRQYLSHSLGDMYLLLLVVNICKMYTVTEFVHVLEKALGNCTNETLKSEFIKSRAGSCVSGSGAPRLFIGKMIEIA